MARTPGQTLFFNFNRMNSIEIRQEPEKVRFPLVRFFPFAHCYEQECFLSADSKQMDATGMNLIFSLPSNSAPAI
jgi:hypothetical protein